MLPVPPVIIAVAGVAGLYALGRLMAKQWRRVNAELHARTEPQTELEQVRTLKRDPRTGVYRAE